MWKIKDFVSDLDFLLPIYIFCFRPRFLCSDLKTKDSQVRPKIWLAGFLSLTIRFRTDLKIFRTDLNFFRPILKWIVRKKKQANQIQDEFQDCPGQPSNLRSYLVRAVRELRIFVVVTNFPYEFVDIFRSDLKLDKLVLKLAIQLINFLNPKLGRTQAFFYRAKDFLSSLDFLLPT